MSAYWAGDQNNPNRDLSDPTWVSAEGAHSMRRAQTARYHASKPVKGDWKTCKTCDNGLDEEEEEFEQCWDCAKIELIVEELEDVLKNWILTTHQKRKILSEVFP